ncbi:MAG TPA: gluconate 2-dehydrogenase subunit 3 family protein [Woeseiaceae bacterium]|nr:gluconate 2-dehydrogenase subunit 3 family protein [Woeseiaceae bacterium]
MKNKKHWSRRGFLQSAGTLASVNALGIGAPALAAISAAANEANAANAAFVALGNDDAADFAAIAARIIPTTDTPGATEAGVIHFIDQAFAVEMRDAMDFALQGLQVINARLDGRFADLDTETQDALLRNIEQGELFGLLRSMTIFGFFSMSKYGGNANHIGWDLIGFEGHHGPWQYPFGYYDADVHGGNDNGQ